MNPVHYAAKVCAECHHYYNTEDVVIFLEQVGINSSMIIPRPSAILCVCMFLQSVRPAPDANVYVFPIHVVAFPSSSAEDLSHNLGPFAIPAPVPIELLVKVAKEICHSRPQLSIHIIECTQTAVWEFVTVITSISVILRHWIYRCVLYLVNTKVIAEPGTIPFPLTFSTVLYEEKVK